MPSESSRPRDALSVRAVRLLRLVQVNFGSEDFDLFSDLVCSVRCACTSVARTSVIVRQTTHNTTVCSNLTVFSPKIIHHPCYRTFVNSCRSPATMWLHFRIFKRGLKNVLLNVSIRRYLSISNRRVVSK